MPKVRHQANRGKQFEDFLNLTHNMYRAQRRALISKVPTEWRPLRDQGGKINGAKVEHKAIVDYLGTYKALPIAFDAKHTGEHFIRWDKLEDHQADFLRDWARLGGIALVLVSFHMDFVAAIPFEFWEVNTEMWRRGQGPASLSMDKVPPMWFAPRGDYLQVVDKFLVGKLGEQDKADGAELAAVSRAMPAAAPLIGGR